MNSADIYQATKDIANLKGTNVKKVKLAVLMEDEDFCEVLEYAMNPFKMFNIGESKIQTIMDKAAPSHEGSGFTEDTFVMLDDLVSGKLSGNAAIDAIVEEGNSLNKGSFVLLTMMLEKDLEMKVGISTVNQVKKGFIEKFSCMLAHKYDASRNSYPVIVEEKLDGMRVLAIAKQSGEVTFVSREGNPQPSLEWMADDVRDVMDKMNYRVDMIFDAEVISGSFNDTVSNVRKKSAQAADSKLFIFHYGLYEDFLADNDSRTMGQIKTEMKGIKANISEDSSIKIHSHYFANNEMEILQMYAKVREGEGEGIIVKARDAKYTNRRNHAWMKMKNNSTIDVKVIDWEEGTGEIEGMLGAFVVDVDGVSVNVGSGFSKKQRIDFWDNIEDFEDQLIEVSYHEKTPAGSLRHPVFEKVRGDKSAVNTSS